MKKRLLASLMAAVMVLTMLPATALASETDPFGYNYDRDDDGVNDSWNVSAEGEGNTVYAYLMSNEHTIEATYGKVIDLAPGYTLHVDGTGAMKDYAKNSTAATTDKPIYTSAPWWTTSVLSTETIDADGTAYDGTYLTGITKIVVGSSITRIGSSAFSFMRDVTEVEIANTVTSIGDRAFMYNYSLESIDFPDSVVMNTLAGSNEDKDGELLVGHSLNLKTVTLGSGFTVIPCRAFENTPVTPDSITFGNKSGITGIGVQAFFRNEGEISVEELDLTSFTGLTEIATNAFSHWSIQSLKLPASIEKLGQFNTVSDLNEVNWTDLTNLTEIASSAFSGTDLTAVDLSNTKVSTIGWRAFYNCSQLKSVILPNTISSIGDEAFMDMAESSSITIPEEKYSLLTGKYTESKTDVITIGSETPDDSDLIVLTHDEVNSYYSSLGAAARNAVAGDSLAIVDGKTYTFADGEVAVVADGVTVSDALKTACGATYADKDSSYTAYCDTLQTALAHCEDGSLVTLNKDVAVSANLQITSDITIDLNDHTVTNSSSFAAPFLIKAGVECTIQNGAVSNTCSDWGICNDTEDGSVTTLSDLSLTNTNKQNSIPSSIRVRSCIVVLDGVTMEDQYLYHDSAEHNSTVFFTGNNSLGTNLLNSGIGSWSLYFDNTESGTQPIPDRTNVTQYVLNCGVDDLTSLDPVQRTGYGLTWYTDSSCTGTPVESLTPNETYYAKWIEETEEETTDADSATELAESPNTGVSNVTENETAPGSTTGDSVSQETDPTQAQSDLTPIESAEEEPTEEVLEENPVDTASKTENENTLTMSLTHMDAGDTVYSFYVGNEKLGETDTGETTLSYDTTLKGLKIGPNTVTVYVGRDNSGSQVGTITVNLKQKSVTVTGLTAVDRDYNGSRTVTLTGGTLTGICTEPDGTVDDVGFTATGTVSSASAGTNKPVTVTVTLTGDDADWYTAAASGTVTVDIYETSGSSGGSDSEPSYSPILDVSDGGEISVNPRTPEEDEDVTITIDPDAGYELDDLTVTDRNGREIDVTANRDGTYTFTQPRGRVTISVTFARTGGDTFFVDVPETFWARNEIEWAYENGYVNGITATTFNPNGAISRQQVWMILARLSSAAPANMAEARTWAMENGVSDGTNPGNAVTRQQLVALLFRYATLMGYANDQRADLSNFSDADSVATYAVEPFQWSVANNIVAGTSDGILNPTGTATRAQFAVILYRFWEQIG